MTYKLIDYERLKAFSEKLKTKYATKSDLPKKLTDLQDDENHRLITDADKAKINNSIKEITLFHNTINETYLRYLTHANSKKSILIPYANTKSAGLMSSADKQKLDGIKNGANKITKLSELENDKTFKTESEIQAMIENASSLKKEVVTSLPTTGKDDVIYLVKDDKGKENNNYLEYLWLNGKYELIGSTQVDLKNYARKIEIKTQLSEMTEDTTHRTVTDTEKNKWNNKVDKVDGKGLSTNDYTDEDKGKINAIPPNPKYTDTIPDLTPYAKKGNIPTKVSQLENDNNYITGKETLFLNTFNGVYKILDGWNNFYFNQGWQLCESDDQPDSPCDNKQRTKYLVYTAFNAKVDDNGLNPILSEEVWQFAWHNLSGTWFCRRGTPRNDEKPTFYGQIQNDDNSFHYCYTISPKWSKWVANKSNIDIQEFTQQELEEAFR